MNTKEENIFLDDISLRRSKRGSQKQDSPITLPYLKRGDTTMYIEQFLDRPPTQSSRQASLQMQMPKHPVVEEVEDENESPQHSESNNSSADSNNRGSSSFHNFQKHLTIAIKKSIDFADSEQQNQKIGNKLWRAFQRSQVSSKRILHFLLGQKNQFQLTREDLKNYGLLKICQSTSEAILGEAREYLARQTLIQIKKGKLNKYIDEKKLKNKDKFRRYVGIFVEQLEEGVLRKRLPRKKVAQLLQ